MRSGIDLFGICYTTVPLAQVFGISVTKTGRYRPQLWLSWVFMLLGAGLLSSVHASTGGAKTIGYLDHFRHGNRHPYGCYILSNSRSDTAVLEHKMPLAFICSYGTWPRCAGLIWLTFKCSLITIGVGSYCRRYYPPKRAEATFAERIYRTLSKWDVDCILHHSRHSDAGRAA